MSFPHTRGGVPYFKVYRGMALPRDMVDAEVTALKGTYKMSKSIDLAGNAASSWTTDLNIAKQFGEGKYNGVVIEAIVPREQILGTAWTGMVCLTEREVVILGTSNDKARIIELIIEGRLK